MKDTVGKAKYLDCCVVKYMNRAAFVRAGDSAISVRDLRSNDKLYEGPWTSRTNGYRLEGLDVTSPKLGYVNIEGSHADYVYRKATRQWRQGITDSVLATYRGGLRRQLPGPVLADLIEGVYPSLADAMAIASRFNNIVAFHRKFAVLPDGRVEFMGRTIVGNANEAGLTFEGSIRNVLAVMAEVTV